MGDSILTSKLQVLHFIVQDVRLCMDLRYVKKVLPLAQLEPVPTGPNYLAGLLNLAGTSVPVLDMGICLGLQRKKPYTLETPMIICSDEQRGVAMIVDKIIGLPIIETSTIQMHDEFQKGITPFSAVVTINAELAMLLDKDYVLSIDIISNISFSLRNSDLMQKTMDKI